MIPDLRPVVVMAIVGLVATALAVLIGLPWLIYYLWTHIQWIN